MSEQVLELTEHDFGQTVGSGVTLVDFWAPWCGPCRMQAPILDAVARSVEGRARIAKVNVDDHPEIARQYGVQSIPTLILIRGGQEIRRFVGVQPEAALVAAIESGLQT